MADLGLGCLAEIKRQLLAASLRSGTDYDSIVTALARGVVGEFDRSCNRKFGRSTAAVDIFSADRVEWFLERSPVESIASVHIRENNTLGWVSQTVNDIIENQDDSKGWIYFGAHPGARSVLVKITYTGGYWYDTAETEDTEQPAGTTALPHEIKQAWYLQCRKVWEALDKLGGKITAVGPGSQFVSGTLGDLKLVPAVEAVLQKYVRYQMT